MNPLPHRRTRQQFHLMRHRDLSGVSGAGVVADGVRFAGPWTFDFPDGLLVMAPGWCELRWRGDRRSTSLWQSIDTMMSVHGHDGATELVWEDV
jgi:hypothetical protein